VDVLVIGAGVAGAVVAKRLVEAGVRVMCLEQGDWPDRADYPGASPEWELRAAKEWSSSPQVRDAPGDYPIDLDGSELVQREDDRAETVRRRLEVYHSQTEPLIAYYEERGLLCRFDGTLPPDQVYAHIRAALATVRLEESL